MVCGRVVGSGAINTINAIDAIDAEAWLRDPCRFATGTPARLVEPAALVETEAAADTSCRRHGQVRAALPHRAVQMLQVCEHFALCDAYRLRELADAVRLAVGQERAQRLAQRLGAFGRCRQGSVAHGVVTGYALGRGFGALLL